MLRSQPIKAPRDNSGEFYSVMSRHTLNDGITPDPEIICDSHHHLKILAPPERLVGDWYRGRIGNGVRDDLNFETEFRDRYLDHLSSPAAELAIRQLSTRALEETITLMCIEPTPVPGELLLCHRRLLLLQSQQLTPQLQINIK